MSIQQVENSEELMNKLSLYTFLQRFYAGHLNSLNKEQWSELVACITEDRAALIHENIDKGIEILSNVTNQDIQNLQYDFNYLFVGPMKLEASPYESSYRNENGAVMQYYTLAVRHFYSKAGLTLVNKNRDPEDHLALELEFVCYLLGNDAEDNNYMQLYKDFIKTHLSQWIDQHCNRIREKTTNHLILGISYLLQGLIDMENQK